MNLTPSTDCHRSTLYLAFTLFALLCLTALLLKPGRGRAMTVWLLAALIPLLTAVTVALGNSPR